MLRQFAVSTLLLASLQAAAETTLWPWEIKEVKLREIQEASVAPLIVDNDCDPLNGGLGPLTEEVAWDEIVRVGEQVWKIVENNKPIVEFKGPVVHALPRGLRCWSELENWQAPVTRSFEVVYVNGFDIEVVKLRFRLHYTYGGGKAGMGRYLANVTVMPAELSATWGYKLNASVETGETVNLGTRSNPVAGLEMNIKWNVSTLAKESKNTFHFFVQGDGVSKSAE